MSFHIYIYIFIQNECEEVVLYFIRYEMSTNYNKSQMVVLEKLDTQQTDGITRDNMRSLGALGE